MQFFYFYICLQMLLAWRLAFNAHWLPGIASSACCPAFSAFCTAFLTAILPHLLITARWLASSACCLASTACCPASSASYTAFFARCLSLPAHFPSSPVCFFGLM
jgi:hypothetical protein